MKIIFILTLLGIMLLYGDESGKEISYKELPEIVKTKLSEITKDLNVTTIEQIEEGGKVWYEIEGQKDGMSLDITISDLGLLIELEEEIELTKLPLKFKEELQARYPGINITEIENVTQLLYEIEAEIKGSPVKIKIYPNGIIEDEVPEKFEVDDSWESKK